MRRMWVLAVELGVSPEVWWRYKSRSKESVKGQEGWNGVGGRGGGSRSYLNSLCSPKPKPFSSVPNEAHDGGTLTCSCERQLWGQVTAWPTPKSVWRLWGGPYEDTEQDQHRDFHRTHSEWVHNLQSVERECCPVTIPLYNVVFVLLWGGLWGKN